jgi:hypothetical protein
MKSLKLIAASLLAFAAAGLANATPVYVHLAGATAFRAPTNAAIKAILVPSSIACAYSGTDYASSSAAIVRGNLVSDGTDVIIKTYWTGSCAGVVDIVEGTVLTKFIPDSYLPAAGATDVNLASYTGENGTPGLTMSDASSDNCGASVATAGAPQGGQYSADVKGAVFVDAGTGATAAAATVGIVPFKWVAGKQSSGTCPLTNITQQQAALLIKAGAHPLDFFTGNSADSGDFVFLVGRNEDSGTRITTFAEAQQGFGQPCVQWQIQIDGSYTTPSAVGTAVTGLQKWPGNTALNGNTNLKWAAVGHSGYNGGGDVKNVLKTPNPLTGLTIPSGAPTGWSSSSSKSYLVTCAGYADADSIASAGGTNLSYNGVAYSAAAVKAGQYTLWGYEHCYRLGSSSSNTTGLTQNVLAGTQITVANQIADAMFGGLATTDGAGILYTDMLSSRTTVGAYVK